MKKFDQDLETLRSVPNDDAGLSLVRRTLGNRNNLLVAKAAQKAEQYNWRQLVPELAKAFDRFFEAADKQCWAKNALAKALAAMDYDQPELFIRGVRHVQMEAVFGGYTDVAGTLRGQCALALVQCRKLTDLEVLVYLTEVLADGDKSVRAEAARAIANLSRPEGGLLLRLRVLSGESDPDVLNAVFQGILEISKSDGIAFVRRFLDSADRDVTAEAALALGLTHDEQVFPILRERVERERLPELRGALLRAIALTRLPHALQWLVGQVKLGGAKGRSAREALTCIPLPDEIRNSLPEE